MRTHLEFRSAAFPACEGEEEEINPGRFGRRLARFLASELPGHGYEVAGLGAEDWGWRIDLRNERFPLWIGCGNYEDYEDGFLCFIEPSRPHVRRSFRRISTAGEVERLATTLEKIIAATGTARDLRWWPGTAPE
jgi:hypothetical protein